MRTLKITNVECNSLESVLELFGYEDIEAIRNDLHKKYETTVIEFWQLVDFLEERKMKPITHRDETECYYDQLMDYPVAIFQ